jgi:F-type H+-transporting ATPase subunit gamma
MMAKARAIVKRRKAVQNIRKITRTMELIATNRFKKALDRATEAEAFTQKISELVSELGTTAPEQSHPLLLERESIRKGLLLVLTSNRGLAGAYNGNVLRASNQRLHDAQTEAVETTLEVSGKRGINYFRFRKLVAAASYTQFEDRPQFQEVDTLAEKYIKLYTSGEIDRFDVAYTQFISASRQVAGVHMLLPITREQIAHAAASVRQTKPAARESAGPPAKGQPVPYEFLPDPASILEEIVPVAFKARLFKCFLDAAVSEQISRMVAMGAATKNADDLVRSLTRAYNRARQTQITRELADVVGASAALK